MQIFQKLSGDEKEEEKVGTRIRRGPNRRINNFRKYSGEGGRMYNKKMRFSKISTEQVI